MAETGMTDGACHPHDELFWSIRGIDDLFGIIHSRWADKFGVTAPQLRIIFALRDFDPQGKGLPVKEVARILGVDPTFATTQSKILEAKGFLKRISSTEDARVVDMSLSAKSLHQLTGLNARQRKITDYIFSEFTEHGIRSLANKLSGVRRRMEKASAIASIDLDD